MNAATFHTLTEAKTAGFTMDNLRFDENLFDGTGGYALVRSSLTAYAAFRGIDPVGAIELALEDGFTLNNYTNNASDVHEDCWRGYAEELAACDPSTFYLTTTYKITL